MAAYLALVALQEKNRSGKDRSSTWRSTSRCSPFWGRRSSTTTNSASFKNATAAAFPSRHPANLPHQGRQMGVDLRQRPVTFERMCEALEVPELISDPRFLDNRLRIQNAVALDEALQARSSVSTATTSSPCSTSSKPPSRRATTSRRSSRTPISRRARTSSASTMTSSAPLFACRTWSAVSRGLPARSTPRSGARFKQSRDPRRAIGI